mmetsp:Transcript_8004/g.19242  ORF Transcript_8004/g.19242 Transcript_8004/m.19242 type:complete len:214 (+) Transcript_8004:560-1201(+)
MLCTMSTFSADPACFAGDPCLLGDATFRSDFSSVFVTATPSFAFSVRASAFCTTCTAFSASAFRSSASSFARFSFAAASRAASVAARSASAFFALAAFSLYSVTSSFNFFAIGRKISVSISSIQRCQISAGSFFFCCAVKPPHQRWCSCPEPYRLKLYFPPLLRLATIFKEFAVIWYTLWPQPEPENRLSQSVSSRRRSPSDSFARSVSRSWI